MQKITCLQYPLVIFIELMIHADKRSGYNATESHIIENLELSIRLLQSHSNYLYCTKLH